MNDEHLTPDEVQTVRERLGDLVDMETVREDTGRTWFPLMAGERLFPAYRDPDGKQGVLMDKPLLPGESLRDGLRRFGLV